MESSSVGGVGASLSEWRVLASSTSDSGVHRGHDDVVELVLLVFVGCLLLWCVPWRG